jgi:hypothetical protein
MTTYKDYEFAISVTEINPPIAGELKFAGKLQFLFNHQKKIWIVENGKAMFAPPPLCSESWGQTREEASEKAGRNIKDWIDKQPATRQNNQIV